MSPFHEPLLLYFFFLLWHCGPTRAMASSFLRFLDHTQRRIAVGRIPLDEWSARRRDLYLTAHNTHNRQTAMPPLGFEPTISTGERRQTYALDRAATGTGDVMELQKEDGKHSRSILSPSAMNRVQTQVSDWDLLLRRARWNSYSKIDTLWHNSSGVCVCVCVSACVWTNRKWKSYFWPGDWNACSSLRKPPQEHCRRVCDRVGFL